MGNFIVIVSSIVLTFFLSYCFYQAWYNAAEFENKLTKVDESIDAGHIFWHALTVFVLGFTIWGSIYSWFRF